MDIDTDRLSLSAIDDFLETIDRDFSAKWNSNTKHESITITNEIETKKSCKPATISEDERIPYSTTLQRRKRAELLKLRTLVQNLEIQVAELQHKRHKHIQTASSLALGRQHLNALHWRSVAAIANEQRQHAERINRELKAIMENHLNVLASIANQLRKNDLIKEVDMNFVFQLQPQFEIQPFQQKFRAAVVEELTESLGSLYEKTRTMFQIMNTSTAMDKKTPGPHDMKCFSTLLEDLLWLDQVSIFRRYNESNQIVLVGTSKWFLPSETLVLQDYNWTIISPSLTNETNECVIQNGYTLETTSNWGAESPTQTMLLDLVGNKMRIITQAMQDILLSHGECR
ncbi:Hypothetical protein PHPALM_19965 [Phytophthora palmivora]|uniref:Uncharacterized protein n=1 Tax=Phytophthora palmivora TaxID=4796 RepID=A0A2P4XG17_9STRA|nr:Hypothetical protein PHPALM_19965 [Phytophthora palmivora]